MEDPMASTEDVVVYVVRPDNTIQSWGRGTEAEAIAFCLRPKDPAQPTDRFFAVNDWGHGSCVAAYNGGENLLGLPKKEVFEAFARLQS